MTEPGRAIRALHLLAPAPEGGLETVVRTLARNAAPAGIEAGVLVLNQLPGVHPFTASARGDGLAVGEVSAGGRHYLAEAGAVAAHLTAGGWDLLHTHGYHADLVGRLAARRTGRPIVSTAHGTTGGDWKNRMYERLQRFAWRGFDRVIAVSAPLESRLAATGVSRRRLVMIRNAFESRAVSSPAEARAALGVSAETVRIGWVGRLGAEKGPDVVLRAFASLGRREVALSIIGDGRERDALVALAEALGISGRVTWHRGVSGAGALLGAFNVVVLSSRTEGTPMVLFEAMAAGVPVVTTAVGGIPDVVGPGEALLVPPEAPGALASAIAAALDDAAGARIRAAAARARLAAEFGVAPWLERHRALYAGVLAARGGASAR